MLLSNMSNCELLLLANNVSLALTNDLNADETALLSTFLTIVADQIALISVQKTTTLDTNDI